MLVEMTILFTSKQMEEMKEMGIDTNLTEAEKDLQVFELNDIECFNPSTDDRLTTVYMKSGMSFMVVMDYEQFKDVVTQYRGKIIKF